MLYIHVYNPFHKSLHPHQEHPTLKRTKTPMIFFFYFTKAHFYKDSQKKKTKKTHHFRTQIFTNNINNISITNNTNNNTELN